MLVRARTRTVSKKVRRFLLVGRVVMKKLTRATQQRLEMVKERRQRSNRIVAILPPTYFFRKTRDPGALGVFGAIYNVTLMPCSLMSRDYIKIDEIPPIPDL